MAMGHFAQIPQTSERLPPQTGRRWERTPSLPGAPPGPICLPFGRLMRAIYEFTT